MTRTRSLVALVACVAIAVAAAFGIFEWTRGGNPPRAERAGQQPRIDKIVGVNYPALWSDMTPERRAQTLDTLQSAGVNWVRLDVSWAMLQPRARGEFDTVWGVPQVDQRIAEIKSRGMQILLVLYWAPEWATGTAAKNGVPKNPADYAAAASYAAHRWSDSVDAWEVWNEPDSAAFWAHPSVTDYAALLKASYPAFKNADPSATVVAGAPTYVNTKWYAQLYRAGAQPYFDVVGVHPYMSPGDLPPGLPDDATMNHLRHLDTLVALMARHGDAKKPIWATELGWSVHANPPGTLPWERGVTEAHQAKYLTDAVAVLRTFPQVDALFWYNSNDSQISGPHVGRFGLLREDGSPRPALDALGCAARGGC